MPLRIAQIFVETKARHRFHEKRIPPPFELRHGAIGHELDGVELINLVSKLVNHVGINAAVERRLKSYVGIVEIDAIKADGEFVAQASQIRLVQARAIANDETAPVDEPIL